MNLAAEIIAFLIQAAPEIQQAVMAVISSIKDFQAGKLTLEQAQSTANEALGLMYGRLANPQGDAAATNAAVDAEVTAKFPPQ